MTGRTVNFTGTVDRDLLRRLKILAAKLVTSINALFNAELRHLVETYEAAEAHGNHNFQTLLDFSLGRINDLQAMEALGIQSEEDLFLLMVSTRAFLQFLEQSNWIPSAVEVERRAITAGRQFSQIRFPS